MMSRGRELRPSVGWASRRTVVGGADAAGGDDEVVALHHPAACLDAGGSQQALGQAGTTHISSSSSAMTSMRLLGTGQGGDGRQGGAHRSMPCSKQKRAK